MAYIVLPSRWTRQPPGPVAVDWANPLARDLVAAYDGRIGADTASGVVWGTRVGTLGYAASPVGAALTTDGTSSYLRGATPQVTSTSLSILAVVMATAAPAADSRALSWATNDANPIFAIGTAVSGDFSKARVWSRDLAGNLPSNTAVVTTRSVFEVGIPHVCLLSLDAGSSLIRSYVDGSADASTTTTSASWRLDILTAGALYRTSAATFFAGGVFLGATWKRALSAAEGIEVTRRPWQLFRPLPRRVFYSLGAGGGAQSLTPTKVTNTSTFGSPTVTRGAVTLAPTKVTNTSTFGSPTVTPGAVTLAATKFSNTSTFGSPTVSTSTGLQATKVTNTSTFGSPTVTPGAVTLAPTKVTNTSTFGSPTVTQGFLLQATKFTNVSTFGAPTITVGGVTLTCSIFVNTSTFGAHTLTGGAVTETPRQGGGIAYQRPRRKRKKWELPYEYERAEAMLDAVASSPVTVQDFARSWAEDFEATAKSLRALLSEFKAAQDKAEEAREIAATLAELKSLMATFRKALAVEKERERRAQWAKENDALVLEMYRNHRRERLARIRRALESL